jgi:hypothetical protein
MTNVIEDFNYSIKFREYFNVNNFTNEIFISNLGSMDDCQMGFWVFN